MYLHYKLLYKRKHRFIVRMCGDDVYCYEKLTKLINLIVVTSSVKVESYFNKTNFYGI